MICITKIHVFDHKKIDLNQIYPMLLFWNHDVVATLDFCRKPIINGGAIRPTGLLFIACIQLLEMIMLNCQEIDLIEVFERSFSRSEKSGLAHFLIITYIIHRLSVVTKCCPNVLHYVSYMV